MARPKENNQIGEPVVEYKSLYPIITIYILGYNLDDLPYLAVTVNRDIINAVNKEKIEVKSFFIEHLTHQSHIIQIRHLPEKRRTRLEKFLIFFNQAWCTSDGYIIDIDQHEIPPEFSDIAKYLQAPVMDASFRRNLEVEEELDLIFDQQERKFMKKIEEAEKKEEEARKREEEAKKREEEERKQKKEFAQKLARQMKFYGASIEEIKKETGLSAEEITSLLG